MVIDNERGARAILTGRGRDMGEGEGEEKRE